MTPEQAVYLEASEIADPLELASFLDRACGGDPLFRAAVEALLADERAANSYFNGVAEIAVRADEAPRQIGPYHILECIGEGGMGEVYRAEQRSPIRREVAIKLIKLGMHTREVVARFEAERQALAMMDHPNIARIYGADADELGRPYFAMEFVRGIPIMEYADTHCLTLRQRLELFQQVCLAIQHAHHKGLVHRDISPSNVLVSTQDGRPFAKVIDFGIAKALNQPLTENSFHTLQGQFIGKPLYMSPEQLDGRLDIDGRADVYSLGVLLYELLAGITPHDPARIRRIPHDMASILYHERPPKPSTRLGSLAGSPKGLRMSKGKALKKACPRVLDDLAKARAMNPHRFLKALRGDLDRMVMKAVEKERDERYEKPSDISDDICRYLNGQPVKAGPFSFANRMKKLLEKQRKVIFKGGAAAILAATGIHASFRHYKTAAGSEAPVHDATAENFSPALTSDEEKLAVFKAVLMGHEWLYQDPGFPPSVIRFLPDGKCHDVWNWYYWVKRPGLLHVQYDLPTYDPASAVSFVFNHDYTGFFCEFTDPKGKTHQVTGRRLNALRDTPGEVKGGKAASPEAASLDHQHKLALSILSKGGWVEIWRGKDKVKYDKDDGAKLPSEKIELAAISLTGSLFTESDAVLLEACGKLEWIDLVQCSVESFRVAPLKSLTELRFYRCTLQADVCHDLSGNPMLRSFSVRRSPGASGADLVRGLGTCPNLESIDLSHTGIGNTSLQPLAGLKNLKGLSLDANRLTIDEMKPIGDMTKLELLTLWHLDLREMDFSFVKRLPHLNCLACGDAKLPRDATSFLARHPSLDKLELAQSDLSSEMLDSLRDMDHLTKLVIDNTRISDDCLPYLKRLTNLRRLVITSTDISKEGVSSLRTALPGCRIDY